LSPEEVERATVVLERLSGRRRDSFEDFRLGRRRAGRRRKGVYRGWTRPDGVAQTPELWPIFLNSAIVAAAREILGNDACFLQHNDLHAGFSALSWHRDSVTRRLGDHGDWDESREPYRLARVGFYLHRPAESGFALGLVPRSHRRGGALEDAELVRMDRAARPLAQAMAALTKRDPLGRRADWIGAVPGDALFFDPRVLHAGSRFSGPKYSAFVAFGKPGAHFARHQAYYRHVRAELRYRPLPAELVTRLREAGLLAEELPEPDGLGSAFIPSWLHTWLGRALRP
jgi:hypothetical protein